MKKKIYPKKLKDLGMVGGAYFNNFGVKVFLTDNDMLYIQGYKLGKQIYGWNSVVTRSFYESEIENDSRSSVTNITKALQYLEDLDRINRGLPPIYDAD